MKKKRRGGQSIIEVVIATLLVAMMTVPIVAAALSGHQLTAKASHKLQAAADARRVEEALKAYVVACPYSPLGTPCAPDSLPRGPGGGAGGWALPGDASGLNALDAGHHALDASAWLPGLDAPPYNGTVSYDVAVRMTPQGLQPDVVFHINWTDQ